jgi:hypothetical protein
MIWLSLNLLLRMLLTPLMDSTITWRNFRGAGQQAKQLWGDLCVKGRPTGVHSFAPVMPSRGSRKQPLGFDEGRYRHL